MSELDVLFEKLAQSKFRRRFRLNRTDLGYLQKKGLPEILKHAEQFVLARLAPATPHNDGKQTPYRGHPVFVGQHATATCCRTCIEKWHQMPKGVELNAEQQEHIVKVLEHWLRNELNAVAKMPATEKPSKPKRKSAASTQLSLFDRGEDT